mgnify:FL=1
MAETQRTVLLSGMPLVYTLERKNVKNLNLRIYPDGSVRVSANRRVPIREIEAFLASHEDFIRKAQSRFRARPQAQPLQYVTGEQLPFLGETLELQVISGERETAALENGKLVLRLKNPGNFSRREKLVNRFWDAQCQAVFPEILRECYPLFQDLGVPYPTLRIRSMKSRWGSCLPGKGIITLSKQLLAAPRECIRYVVVHEYCHFLHPNHGKGFYALLADRMPDWKERKKRLNGGGR